MSFFMIDSHLMFPPADPYDGDLQPSGDMQTGSDYILVSGDEQSGTDRLQLSGNVNG
jgi:hypothetical protein